jgi:8-oxo-dGTP pyrophosphatase MutT (NUDIX family)
MLPSSEPPHTPHIPDLPLPDLPHVVAVALLYQNDRYLMQLRDNIPTIIYPDHWAFFGGHIEPGETPKIGVLRELTEEIGYEPPQLDFFRTYTTDQAVRHVFYGALTVELDRLVLGEGADLKLVSPAEIEAGEAFSTALQQVKPLGAPHRQVLLEFMDFLTTLHSSLSTNHSPLFTLH